MQEIEGKEYQQVISLNVVQSKKLLQKIRTKQQLRSGTTASYKQIQECTPNICVSEVTLFLRK